MGRRQGGRLDSRRAPDGSVPRPGGGEASVWGAPPIQRWLSSHQGRRLRPDLPRLNDASFAWRTDSKIAAVYCASQASQTGIAVEISQLKTLIHVAELGSLSKAADRLNVAQPALSRQIRLLEKELGAYLFSRHGRGMVINEAGREVLDHATRIMAELEAIRDSVAVAPSSFTGAVAIGTTVTVAEIVSVPLIALIKRAHPHLAVRLSAAFSGYLIDWLQKNLTSSFPTTPSLSAPCGSCRS